jgi:hypothetical protein
MGEGVKPTAVGAFAKYTTAFVEENLAKDFATQQGFVVADPTGKEHGNGGGAPAAKAPEPKKAEEAEPSDKKDEKAEKKDDKGGKKDEKKSDKKDEKAAEKK